MVSIIIATYNSDKTLRSALESIIKLEFNDWECIVIDNVSSDGTINIIREYRESDRRFKYISEKDNGIYYALNKGWEMAHGEWIYVLGSDDELTKNGLPCLLSSPCEDFDIIYGNVYLKSKEGNISTFIAKKHTRLKYVMNCSHQGLIMRRSVIEKLGGFNEKYKIRADFDILQRAFLSHYSFLKKNIEVAYFSETGLSSSSDFSTHIERYEICKANKSTHFPFLFYMYQESKFLVRYLIKHFLKINKI